MTWRFHLMSLPSRVWVDHDLPLAGASVTEVLSGPASISGSLSLGYENRDQVKEWGSMIVAEQEGRDPVVGIVDGLTTAGDTLKVEAGGFSMYPTGMPWVDAEYSSTGVDPLDVVRLVWASLQSKPGGNLGVVVDTDKSSTRLGVPESAARTKAKSGVASAKANEATAKATYDAAVKAQNVAKISLLAAAGRPANGLVIHQDSAPSGDKRSALHLWIDKNAGNLAYRWDGKKWVRETSSSQTTINIRLGAWTSAGATVTSTKATYTTRKTEHTTAKSKLSAVQGGEADPFTLTWWENHDLGAVIDDMVKAAPAEYREVSAWAGEAITHRLEIGVPALGARRPDLRFEIGVNVTAPPPLQESDYASEVTVLGAGEGRAMIRATTTGNPGRLRRAVVVDRKDLRKTDAAAAASRAEVAARSAEWGFNSLDVIDHVMAPYGSFRPGDQIYTAGDAGWKQLDHWVRVLEITTDCTTGVMDIRVEVT